MERQETSSHQTSQKTQAQRTVERQPFVLNKFPLDSGFAWDFSSSTRTTARAWSYDVPTKLHTWICTVTTTSPDTDTESACEAQKQTVFRRGIINARLCQRCCRSGREWLTHDHECELKSSLHRFSVNLVGQICKAHVALQVLLLLRTKNKKIKWIESFALMLKSEGSMQDFWLIWEVILWIHTGQFKQKIWESIIWLSQKKSRKQFFMT